jgi:hypothetical protein
MEHMLPVYTFFGSPASVGEYAPLNNPTLDLDDAICQEQMLCVIREYVGACPSNEWVAWQRCEQILQGYSCTFEDIAQMYWANPASVRTAHRRLMKKIPHLFL